MSKHIGRKERWSQDSPRQYSSAWGKVVYQQQAWYGVLDYKTLSPEGGSVPVWTAQTQRLGPFKRPRNAMVALEREMTILTNRHGKEILFGGQVWAEA